MTVQTVNIESIVIPEIRSNAVYTPDKFQELKTSIAASGIQFRPSVRPLPDGRYELIDGKHRLLCWKELGHTEIEVDIENLSDEQAFVKHVVANHHRGESDPVGLSKVIKKLRDQGKTFEDIGKMIGYSASTVSQYSLLADLPEVYQRAISAGQLKLAHIKEASRLDDPADMDAALTFSIQYSWPATVLHHWVEQRVMERQTPLAAPGTQPDQSYTPPPPDPQLAQYRTCLICGAHGIAQEMFYPVLGKECHDSLKYLLSIDKNPWNAIQTVVAQLNVLYAVADVLRVENIENIPDALKAMKVELTDKDGKIKELSDRLIELSMNLIPRAQAAHHAPPLQPQPPTPGGQIPGTQSGAGYRLPSP